MLLCTTQKTSHKEMARDYEQDRPYNYQQQKDKLQLRQIKTHVYCGNNATARKGVTITDSKTEA